MHARSTSTVTRLRLCGALIAVAGSVLAAGCGGSDSSSSSAVGGEPVSFERLAQSASTSAEAKSGRFSFDMSMTFPGTDEPFAFSGEGAFDEASGRAAFAVDMSSFAKLLGGFAAGLAGPDAKDLPDFDDPSGWKIEVVQDGEVGYVRFPALDSQLPEGTSWIRANEGDTSAQTGFDFDEFEQFAKTDPRDLLDSLRAVTSDVETIGSEELRGVETTHYRAVIDPADLAKQAPAAGNEMSQTLVGQLTAQSGLGPIPVDVWIDETGLVRKLAMAFTATEPGSAQSSEVSMSFELWDYGERVGIELPPASQVADASAVR
jgi:hypothetical protein